AECEGLKRGRVGLRRLRRQEGGGKRKQPDESANWRPRAALLSGPFQPRGADGSAHGAARRIGGGAVVHAAHAKVWPANVGRDVELRPTGLDFGRARLSLPEPPSSHRPALARHPEPAVAVVGRVCALSARARSLLDQLLRCERENGAASGSRRGRFLGAGRLAVTWRLLFIPRG